MVGFSEVGALIAKTIEEEIKVVLQKPKWENSVRLTLFCSSEGCIICMLMINCTFTLFDDSIIKSFCQKWTLDTLLFCLLCLSALRLTGHIISQGFERRNISTQKLDSVIQAGKCPRNKWDFLGLCYKQEFRLSTRFQDSITTSPLYPPWAYTAHFASWVIRLHS